MSVQAVSRIAALLALDADVLKKYVPKYADDDEDKEDDLNEKYRARFAHLYRHQLTDNEIKLIEAGNLNRIFRYLANHLEKPVNGESPKDDGTE